MNLARPQRAPRGRRAEKSDPSVWTLVGFMILVVLLVAGCSTGKRVTRVDSDVTVDLSGRWNDTDSRLVAEAMISDALAQPWLDEFTRHEGRRPVVIVGPILNESHEHINTRTFVNDLARELTNARKVQFVAAGTDREALREERRDQAVHAAEETQKRPGRERGADFMLQGTISTIPDEAEGIKVMYYQVDLEMVDLEDNVRSWFGQKKIKKVIERRRFLF